MTEPTIICPSCMVEIKLTESLAAPLIESTRREYEQRLAQKEGDITERETSLRSREEELSKAREAMDDQVAEKVRQERSKIAAEEAKKAKLVVASELDQKAIEISGLQEIVNEREVKLAEAQKAQAELMRKTRELEDAKRELDLTVETRIQEELAAAREDARKKVEETSRDYEQRLAQRDADSAKQEASIREREEALSKARETLDDQVDTRLREERGKIAVEAARKAKQALTTDLDQKTREIADLQEVLKEREAKLSLAQQAQADLLRKQRELDDAKRELELTVETRVQAGLTATRAQGRKEAEDELKLKVMEKEQTITSMQKQIEDLKRRAEQGSQQLQGEVLELELESLLRARFPHDAIESVAKGEHGADVLHRVIGPLGQACGTILWEAKRAKNWNDGWLVKLREDQRAAKAEIAVIISAVLPKDVEAFDLIDLVWVAHPRVAMPVATTLRQALLELAAARQASEGQQSKMEMVYEYLTGPRFRQRVQAIVEAFSGMQEDLDREKKAITKQWAKREEQIARVMQATVGMYGDLQGIAGKTIQEIEGLEMKALEAPSSSTEA